MEIVGLVLLGYFVNVLWLLALVDSPDTLLIRLARASAIIPFLLCLIYGFIIIGLILIFLTPIVGVASLFGLIQDLLRRKECQY